MPHVRRPHHACQAALERVIKYVKIIIFITGALHQSFDQTWVLENLYLGERQHKNDLESEAATHLGS